MRKIVFLQSDVKLNDVNNHEKILLREISLEEFTSIIREIVQEEIQNHLSTKTPSEEYLSRKETASLLKVSLPTLHIYTKQGLIKSHRVLNQIPYKRRKLKVQ